MADVDRGLHVAEPEGELFFLFGDEGLFQFRRERAGGLSRVTRGS